MAQDRKPLPPQTSHKAWAAAAGALMANLAVWLLAALARWITGEPFAVDPETFGALVTLGTAAASTLGAGVGAYVKNNWQVGDRRPVSWCHPLPVLAAVALLLALSGCATAQSARVSAAVERVASTLDVACRTLDGAEVRMTVDVVAAVAGQTDRLELVREVRQAACASVGMVAALAPEVAPVPAPKP